MKIIPKLLRSTASWNCNSRLLQCYSSLSQNPAINSRVRANRHVCLGEEDTLELRVGRRSHSTTDRPKDVGWLNSAAEEDFGAGGKEEGSCALDYVGCKIARQKWVRKLKMTDYQKNRQ